MPSWYPSRDVDQVPWWATFNQECIDRAATFAAILTAGELANILGTKNWVATLVNANDIARNFATEMTAYKNIWMDSPHGIGADPAAPVPPAAIAPPANAQVGIEAYAVLIAGQLSAHPAMTDAIRAAMGILPSGSGLGTVRIVSGTAAAASQVLLRLGLAGYEAVAVYMKRNNVTVRLGVSIDADFTDTTGPLVPGQSESREYWVRGIVNNVEQGAISATVLVATTP
jgi:hypothetical protein